MMKFILVKCNLFIRQNNPCEYTLRNDTNICGAALHELNPLLTNCHFKTDKYWPWNMFTCFYCDSVYKHAKQGYNQYPAILISDSNMFAVLFLTGQLWWTKMITLQPLLKRKCSGSFLMCRRKSFAKMVRICIKIQAWGRVREEEQNILLLLC